MMLHSTNATNSRPCQAVHSQVPGRATPTSSRTTRIIVRGSSRTEADSARVKPGSGVAKYLRSVLSTGSKDVKIPDSEPILRELSSQRVLLRGLKDLRLWRKQQAQGSAGLLEEAGPTIADNTAVFTIALITYSTWILAWASELGGSSASYWVAPTIGAVLGGIFAAAHRTASVRVWKGPRKPLNVVITGATRGIGRAMAREFLQSGDNVYIAARSSKAVRAATNEMQAACQRPRQVWGTDCDVTKAHSVSRLASLAQDHFAGGHVDVWINNAGCSGSFKPFLEADDADLQAVVQTNLLGALLCTRTALQMMSKQPDGGHVFNMDGAGADGTATPNYSAYGATKAGIAHLMQSLSAECQDSDLNVGVHTLSPGMVLTELLLDGATNKNKQVFNVLCEQPETVAAFLVPRIRTVCARNVSMSYIRSLTNVSAIGRFLTAPMRLGRFFAPDGTSTYLSESERLDGRQSKRTARLLSKARSRGSALALAYSTALTISVFLLCSDKV